MDLTSIIVPPFGAICGDDTNNLWILVESFFKSNCVLQILSYALALKFFPVPICNHKQNRTKEQKLPPITPCIIVGQVRVVVVVGVINPPYPSLSLKIEPKRLKYNHQPPKQWLCVNSPSNHSKSFRQNFSFACLEITCVRWQDSNFFSRGDFESREVICYCRSDMFKIEELVWLQHRVSPRCVVAS